MSAAEGDKCTCFWTDPSTWTRYGDAVEPGSQMEPNPECPLHFPDLQSEIDELRTQLIRSLKETWVAENARDEALEGWRRVVANEPNHYDRFWQPAPEPLTEEWLGATETKMREALGDVFCDDAAKVMLTLIAEIRRRHE